MLVIATIAHALLVGCGGGNKQAAENTSGGGNPDTSSPASSSMPDTSADLGAKIYARNCALCHGPKGKGNGPGAAGLNPKPRDHTDAAYMNSRTDEQLLDVIRNGKPGTGMAGWKGVLSEQEIHAVLKHVRSLAGT
jgi:mono/diheme cytochrome c family protein